MRINFLFVVTAFLVSASQAWSINGHLMVSNIAYNLLNERNPESLAAAEKMMTYLTDYDSSFTTHEKNHAFVETATFADDLKYHGEMWQSDFHFLNTPWIETGSESDYDVKSSTRNITTGMADIRDWISGKNGEGYKESYMYTFLMSKFDNDENVAKSYALRLMIHYMGDIVQPLHCEMRYNSDYPDGDKGGNTFPLPNHYSIDELHALWDMVLYTQHTNIARPISDDDWSSFQIEVANITETYKYAAKKTGTYTIDYDMFADESFKIAKTLYDGVTENEAVPQDYLDKNVDVAYERLVLGGYRLYYTITYMFGSSNNLVNDEEIDEAEDFVKMIREIMDIMVPEEPQPVEVTE